jgi:hypothetical protein
MENTVEAGVSPAIDDLVTIAGGEEIEIQRKDGSKETVKVRQIPISKIQEYVLSIGTGQQAKLIALYCNKPGDWVDALDNASALAIARKGRELNGPFAVAWLEEGKEWGKLFTPDGQAAANPDHSVSRSSAKSSPSNTGSSPGK